MPMLFAFGAACVESANGDHYATVIFLAAMLVIAAMPNNPDRY
jgi:hypothetical protein